MRLSARARGFESHTLRSFDNPVRNPVPKGVRITSVSAVSKLNYRLFLGTLAGRVIFMPIAEIRQKLPVKSGKSKNMIKRDAIGWSKNDKSSLPLANKILYLLYTIRQKLYIKRTALSAIPISSIPSILL